MTKAILDFYEKNRSLANAKKLKLCQWTAQVIVPVKA